MVIRQVASTITAGLLVCGLEAIAPANGWAQQAIDLPQERGPITLWGCFQQQEVKNHDKFVLTNPTLGGATSVPTATCTSSGSEQAIVLKPSGRSHMGNYLKKKHGNYEALIGKWVEVSGVLDRMEDANKPEEHLRAVHVQSFREVPVVPPRVVEVIPLPERAPEVPPAPPQAPAYTPPAPAPAAPVATTGYKAKKKLPHTASPLPLTGLIGLLALAGGLALNRVGRQRALGRD